MSERPPLPAPEKRNMVNELREVRKGLRQLRNGLEQTVLDLQTARLAAQEITR